MNGNRHPGVRIAGTKTRTSESPAWAATTMSVTLPSPTLLGSTIATCAGLMTPSPSWRLNCKFIGSPPLRRACGFASSGLPGLP